MQIHSINQIVLELDVQLISSEPQFRAAHYKLGQMLSLIASLFSRLIE